MPCLPPEVSKAKAPKVPLAGVCNCQSLITCSAYTTSPPSRKWERTLANRSRASHASFLQGSSLLQPLRRLCDFMARLRSSCF